MPDAAQPKTFVRKIQLLPYRLPVLTAGKYEITVEQHFSVDGDAAAKASFKAEAQSFVVSSERFTLKPDDVYKVFPPEGSLGDHSNVLPHIVLKRSTLPWERPSGAGKDTSWLALLLF